MSIAVKEYTPKTHEMHSWQLELDMIEDQLIDAGNTVSKLQTFIDQLDEKAASARVLLDDRTVSLNQKKKADSILSKCEAERPKPTRQLEAAKSRVKDLRAKKENFNFPAVQEERRMEKLVRSLAS